MRLGEHGLIRHRKSSQRGTFARKPSLFPEQRTMKQEACWVTNRNLAPSGAGGCQFLHLWPVQNHVVVNLQQRLDCPLAGHAVDDSDAFARLGGIKHTRDVVGVIHLGFWFSPDSKVVTHGSSIFP